MQRAPFAAELFLTLLEETRELPQSFPAISAYCCGRKKIFEFENSSAAWTTSSSPNGCGHRRLFV